MKIYIENIKFINNLNNLDHLYKENINYIEFYSTNGIFNIINNNIYKLLINDKNIEILNININNNLLLDFSEIILNKVNNIPNNYIKYNIKLIKYKSNKESNISFNIKYFNNIIKDFYFEIANLKDVNDFNEVYIEYIKDILNSLKF